MEARQRMYQFSQTKTSVIIYLGKVVVQFLSCYPSLPQCQPITTPSLSFPSLPSRFFFFFPREGQHTHQTIVSHGPHIHKPRHHNRNKTKTKDTISHSHFLSRHMFSLTHSLPHSRECSLEKALSPLNESPYDATPPKCLHPPPPPPSPTL